MKDFLAIEKTDTIKRIYACLIDIATTVALGLLLFFCCFNLAFESMPFIQADKQYMHDTEVTQDKEVDVNGTLETRYGYNLNLKEGLTFDKYYVEAQKFYEYHEEKITTYYFDLAQKDESVDEKYVERFKNIKFIFNFVFVGLSMDPIPTESATYQTDYFIYPFNEDTQEYEWWEYAVPREKDLNDRGIAEREYTVLSSYQAIKKIWGRIDTNYIRSANEIQLYIGVAALLSTAVSILTFYLIIPLSLKHYATLGKKVFGYGYVNKKDHKKLPWWKGVIKTIICMIPFVFGMFLFNVYSLVFFIIAPYGINTLFFVLSKSEQDILDKILRMELINVKKSLFFSSEEEEQKFLEDEYNENITDDDKAYTEALAKMSMLDLKSVEEKIEDETKSNETTK